MNASKFSDVGASVVAVSIVVGVTISVVLLNMALVIGVGTILWKLLGMIA